MRFIWYIAIAFALWYLGKAVIRRFLSGDNKEPKRRVAQKQSQEKRETPSPPLPSENIRDANYRDVE